MPFSHVRLTPFEIYSPSEVSILKDKDGWTESGLVMAAEISYWNCLLAGRSAVSLIVYMFGVISTLHDVFVIVSKQVT